MPRFAAITCIQSLRPRLADERGVAAVEAALAFPFLLALMAGLFEFGSVFYNFELMQTGVRDAGRYLSRVPDLAAAEESAKRLAVTGSIASGQAARVDWWTPGQIRSAIARSRTSRRNDGAAELPRRRHADDRAGEHLGSVRGDGPPRRDRARADSDQRCP